MPLYDLMLLLDPNAPDERRDEIVSQMRGAIEADGALLGQHDWGMRRLAYEIDHRGEADYRLFQFEGPPELVERLDHTLKIADGVLRFRIIRLKPGSPPPPEPRAQSARPEPREEAGTAQVAARSVADAPPSRGR
ncbi:MAG: 30S ribosomal protein S6 [Thermoleophilaceae bacterium]|nr:30S ribosomal protein S6 [Thermoleophilaceae bacterium]